MISVRKMLDHYQIRPQKRLGQSFLKDVNIIRKIVEIADPGGDQTIVEIGAGLGLLTEKLAEKGPDMSAVFIGLTPFTSGMLLFVPTRDLVILEETGIDDAAKLIVSGGLVYPIPKEKERH